jgi:hypothetical protein
MPGLRPLAALGLLVVSAVAAPSLSAGPRPTDPRDAMLYARAVRVGRNVVERHLTPEGLLAYIHRRDATPAQLSHDCLDRADTAIWSGCYAASVACRYAVLRDAESLALARRVAAGLELLSKVTGVEGAIARSAGRAIPGEPLGPKVVPSPLGDGFMYRKDASRDALSGIVLGWTCLAKFVDDAEVRFVAGRNLEAIARRLYRGGMAVREPDGGKTKHGDIDAHVGRSRRLARGHRVRRDPPARGSPARRTSGTRGTSSRARAGTTRSTASRRGWGARSSTRPT